LRQRLLSGSLTLQRGQAAPHFKVRSRCLTQLIFWSKLKDFKVPNPEALCAATQIPIVVFNLVSQYFKRLNFNPIQKVEKVDFEKMLSILANYF
jgi:hypothetical protein